MALADGGTHGVAAIFTDHVFDVLGGLGLVEIHFEKQKNR